jgi:hypothetical protein
MSPNAGEGGVARSQPMSTAIHRSLTAQINFGDLTPYLNNGNHGRKDRELVTYANYILLQCAKVHVELT